MTRQSGWSGGKKIKQNRRNDRNVQMNKLIIHCWEWEKTFMNKTINRR